MTGSLVVGFAHKRGVCNLRAQPGVFTICEDFGATSLAQTNAGGTVKRASACVKRNFNYRDSAPIPPTAWKYYFRKVAQGAGELTKLLVKPPNKLDEEAEMQRNSNQKVPAKLCEERGNYKK